MKKYLLLLLICVAETACEHTSSRAGLNAENVTTLATTEPATANESLTNSALWKGDANTHKNVKTLQQTAYTLNQQERSNAKEYHYISTELQKGLNQLVKECRMKGADHDALHLWLEPLLQEIKTLQRVQDTVTGERLFHSIRTRLADYNFYFQ